MKLKKNFCWRGLKELMFYNFTIRVSVVFNNWFAIWLTVVPSVSTGSTVSTVSTTGRDSVENSGK